MPNVQDNQNKRLKSFLKTTVQQCHHWDQDSDKLAVLFNNSIQMLGKNTVK